MPQKQPVIPHGLTSRSLALRLSSDGTPVTLNAELRTVDVVCSTENPVDVWDWERWEPVPEVLLMSGCQIPKNRQVTLLNTHYRGDISSVLGSCRNLRVENGALVGRVHYSAANSDAKEAFEKTREGHLTDYSVGYLVLESEYIKPGEKKVVAGREFTGPVRVVTQWKVRELSTCPIGADDMAKARAATQPTNPKEKTMPEKDKQDVVEAGRGEQTPTAQHPTPEPVRGLSEADIDRRAEEKARAEIERREEIRSMCEHFGYRDMADELIKGHKSLDEARKVVFEKHVKDQPEAPGFRAAQVLADERDKFRAAAEDSLLLRAGHAVEKPAAGALDLRGYSLRELGREALRMAGQPIGGDPLVMVGRALTTSDFPILLANVANKSLFEGWDGAEETWDKWCDVGSVSDFKTHTSARAGEGADLDEVPESAEYKYGNRAEAKEEYKVATYGKLFSISRQTIINDDLGALTDIPRMHGEAAARKVGDLAYAVLAANSAMGDGVALFHGDHGNLGTTGPISETTVGEAIKLMKLQKDIGGKRRLNISPRYLIAPVALEGRAEVFFNSAQFAGANTAATRTNPYAGARFERVYDARLDDASPTIYYFAGPRGKTVRVFFLNGNRTPYMEMQNQLTVDGVVYKVRIDAGAKAMDWRALFRNASQ